MQGIASPSKKLCRVNAFEIFWDILRHFETRPPGEYNRRTGADVFSPTTSTVASRLGSITSTSTSFSGPAPTARLAMGLTKAALDKTSPVRSDQRMWVQRQWDGFHLRACLLVLRIHVGCAISKRQQAGNVISKLTHIHTSKVNIFDYVTKCHETKYCWIGEKMCCTALSGTWIPCVCKSRLQTAAATKLIEGSEQQKWHKIWAGGNLSLVVRTTDHFSTVQLQLFASLWPYHQEWRVSKRAVIKYLITCGSRRDEAFVKCWICQRS